MIAGHACDARLPASVQSGTRCTELRALRRGEGSTGRLIPFRCFIVEHDGSTPQVTSGALVNLFNPIVYPIRSLRLSAANMHTASRTHLVSYVDRPPFFCSACALSPAGLRGPIR